MIEEFHKADSFYQMKITIRYWFYWRRYINECREEHVIDQHYLFVANIFKDFRLK